MFIFIIGTKWFTWGSRTTQQPHHCNNCGTVAPFLEKTTRQFLALFFFIPLIPVSGKKQILECPNCKTRYASIDAPLPGSHNSTWGSTP